MILALVIFAVTYLLMLALPKERPWVALCSAAVFMALGQLGVYDFSLSAALGAVDYNVLLMMSGTMGIVSLFIRSRMPARLAEQLIVRVPNAQWAVCVLALFAGVISAFVDNVATVLMVAPVGLAIARKLKISPVPVLIAIAVSSNLQGAATLVGDTTAVDMDKISINPHVERVMRVQEPYKKANRLFHPKDTVVDVHGTKIGGGYFSVIAGPCSVESEEQIIGIAKRVEHPLLRQPPFRQKYATTGRRYFT